MIIDLITHTKNHGTKMEAYFKPKEKHIRNGYNSLPTCMRDFIQQHTELYILIDQMLNRRSVQPTHILLAKNIIRQKKEIKIHSSKKSQTAEYFQKLTEKAERSNESVSQELSQSIHSMQCNLLIKDNKKMFQRFKKCWAKFIDHELSELIEEAS